MKITGVLLLASCALLSTLCVANARNIMAANEQDDYEAVLQDLYDTMARVLIQKQNEVDDGDQQARAQFLGDLLKDVFPKILNVFGKAGIKGLRGFGKDIVDGVGNVAERLLKSAIHPETENGRRRRQ